MKIEKYCIDGCRWMMVTGLSFIIYHLSFSVAQAQIGDHRDEFAVGVNGGYVMSTIDFMPVVPQKQFGGLLGSVTFRYTTEKYFSSICAIVGEVNYAQIGWQQDILDSKDNPVINRVTGLPEEYERRINYVQVPLLARMGWGRERKGFQFFVQAPAQHYRQVVVCYQAGRDARGKQVRLRYHGRSGTGIFTPQARTLPDRGPLLLRTGQHLRQFQA